MTDDNKDKITIILDSADKREELGDPTEFCPKCNARTEMGFGLAGGGYGPYSYCMYCAEITGKYVMKDDES